MFAYILHVTHLSCALKDGRENILGLGNKVNKVSGFKSWFIYINHSDDFKQNYLHFFQT